MTKFLDSLKPGDLVFAGSLGAQKIHLVPLENTAFDDDVRALPRTLTEKSRANAIADIEDRRRQLWHATALCGVEGKTAAWGNVARYYWSPRENPSLDTVCQGCMKLWRKNGEPEIVGFDRTTKISDAWPWDLPYGWREVERGSHPWDLPVDVAVETIKDDTGRVRGEHREELRRFVRGPAIVRLVRHTETDTYSARYWTTGGDADEEGYAVEGTLMHAREYCHRLMAVGGYER